jgi:hypothetical protein
MRRDARLLGWERALNSSLAVCSSLLGTAVPSTLVSTGMSSPAWPTLVPAERRVRAPRPSDFQVESEILFHLSLLQTPGGKLRYLAARLFVPTPADCRFLRLPPSLFFLYYLPRPIRVVCKAVEWVVCFGFSRLDHRFPASISTQSLR